MNELTNSQKADVFFDAAMEHLDLMYSNMEDWEVTKQVRPVAPNAGKSAYICDAVISALDWFNIDNDCFGSVQREMKLFGMEHTGYNVWKHIPAEERQEARWFFLMLMVEFLDNEQS